MPPYSAAIIGCGRVAWMLEDDPLETRPCTHMGAYRALEERGRVKVAAASDLDPERLFAFGDRYGVDALYADYREMLTKERPEIVSICAYAPERARMVIDSIEAGARGIWCEKAAAASLAEARELAEAVERAGTAFIVSHMRRWSPEYIKAKEIIEGRGIGELQAIVSHFSGSLAHTGTHAFDVMRWFGGEIDWVEGSLEGGGLEEGLPWERTDDRGGRAFMRFKGGAHGAVFAESKGYFFFEFDVIGSHGRLRIGNNDLLEYYRPAPSLHYTGLKELERTGFPAFVRDNIWVNALTNLIDVMEGKAASGNGARDGYAALEAAIAVHESALAGRRVTLPLAESSLIIRSR